VDVECYDGLGWLSEARATTTDLVLPYARDTIGSLFSFYRAYSPGRWVNTQGGENGRVVAGTAPATTTSDLVGAANSAALSFNGSTVMAAPSASGSATTVAWWFRTTGATATQWMVGYSLTGTGTEETRYAAITSTGKIEVGSRTTTLAPSDIGVTQQTSALGYNDGRWHHVAVQDGGPGDTWVVYVDGLPQSMVTTFTASGGANVSAPAGFVGGRVTNGQAVSNFFTGDIQDVACWQDNLTTAEIVGVYERSLGTFTESTTARAGRILDAVGWPSAWRDLTTKSYGTCTTPPFNGAQAMNLLRDVERTEQGRLFAAKDGDITLHGRYFGTQETRGNTIQVTMSDDGADVSFSAGGYTQEVDDVLNAVTVSLVSGSSSEATNSSSITTYGRKSETVNTLLPNLDLALSMAQGVVLQRKDVLTRIRPVEPAIELTAANWATVLGLEIGDRVRLEMTPSRTGSQLQQSATVEGISIEAHLSHTRASFEASPIPTVSWFVVGTSTVGGAAVLAF